jgi:hypothetical protein
MERYRLRKIRVLSIILAIAMVIGQFQWNGINVRAEESAVYTLDGNIKGTGNA